MQEPSATALKAKFQRALGLHRQGRLADAESIYQDILAQQPSHFDALHLLGVVALQTGRADQAVALIEQAIRLNASIAAAHCNLGHALETLDRLDEAVTSYDRAIALRPDYAEAYNNRGIALQKLQRAEEAVTSYDKAIALRSDYAEAYSNRGLVLRELRRAAEAVASCDKAIALKPDYAEAHSNRGIALQDLRRVEEALASFDAAIAFNPDYAQACYNRGIALHGLNRTAEAVASYTRAIALKPDYVEAYYNRGLALQDLLEPEDALASYDKAIALQPEFAEAHNNRGNALQELRRPDEALASYDAAIALKPDYAEAYHNKGLCSLLMGQFQQGWHLYEWRKRHDESGAVRLYRQPLWLGEQDILGKVLLIYCEQGLGDTIQFCRYAKLVEACGAEVIMQVQQPLTTLLQRVFPTVRVMGPDRQPAGFDYQCPMLSLPLAFGTTLEMIPAEHRYIWADERLRAKWSARLPPKSKLRIGVAWSGGRNHRNDRNRSIDPAALLPLLRLDAEWVCVQKELRPGDQVALRRIEDIAFFGDDLNDFDETAALLDLMDLVITVDTSVAHLAAAMGKPVWLLLPYNPDWRWLLGRDDSPWYPSVRLFRQQRIGHWDGVIAQVMRDLVPLLA